MIYIKIRNLREKTSKIKDLPRKRSIKKGMAKKLR